MTTVRCDYCGTVVPADETFQPFRGGGVNRCKDAAACERRALQLNDPTILAAEDLPGAPPAVPGARCAVCGAVDPPGGVYAGAAYMCLDRAGCGERSVEYQCLTAWTDSGPDRLIAEAGGRLRLPASPSGPEIPPERVELDHAQMAALAAGEALGRKRR